MSEHIEVIQDLLVFGIDADGEELRVDVYGGPECVCGTLIYRFPDVAERRERHRLLRRWRDERVAVTYIRRAGSAALMDERAFLADALGG